MNAATEYLKDQLKKLVDKYKNIKLEYGYEKEYDNHIIEVMPSVTFEDAEFYDIEMSIIKDFYSKFPDQIAIFVYPGALEFTDCDETTEIKGILYK